MKTYRALVASHPKNDIDDFANISCEWRDLEIPKLENADVQIRVKYSSLNYKDALAVTGKGKILRSLPLTPGIDAAGTVCATKSKKFKEGDEVLVTGCGLGENRSGGLGEVITVPDSWVIPMPKALSLRESMILGTAGFTAALALHQLEKNDLTPKAGSVLVTGATGGVGSLSLLMLSYRKYQSVAWTRKRENTERLKSWGAVQVEDVSSQDWKTRPLESARWAAAIDNTGGESLNYILARIQPQGCVGAIGLAKSPDLNTSVFPFILRGVNLLGISSSTCPRPLRERLWLTLGESKIEWTKVLRAEIAPKDVTGECQKLIAGSTWGRVLVRMDS